MKKALMGIGAGLAVLVALLLVVIATRPAVTTVERSVVVAATPDDLWPYVSDLRGFVKWSPWEKLDPTQTVEFSDPSNAVGAWYTWKGNEKVGSGKMTITALEPGANVEQDLEFIEPFPSRADITLALAADPGGTKVTWGFETQNGFMAKAMSLVMDMDAMLGPDFEEGLGSLKTLAEADATARMGREAAVAAAAAATATAEPTPATP